MPKFVDPIYVKTGSTDVLIGSSTGGLYQQGVALPDSTQLGPLKVVTWPSTAAQTLVNTTSVQTLHGKVTSSGCGMAVTLASTADAAIPTHGVVYFVATTAPQAYNLPLPQAQGSRLVLWAQTCNTTDTITLTCTAANLIDTAKKTIVFNTADQYLEMVGLSTTLGWLVLASGSTAGTGPHVTPSLPLFTS